MREERLGGSVMKNVKTVVALSLTLVVIGVTGVAPAWPADESKVDAATKQVESGAEKIGKGVEETAKGIGETVVEGSKAAGEKLKVSGDAAEPAAKDAWTNLKDGANSFGQSVKNFFSTLFE